MDGIQKLNQGNNVQCLYYLQHFSVTKVVRYGMTQRQIHSDRNIVNSAASLSLN